MTDEYVASVTKENNLGVYRLHTTWNSDRFQINIVSHDAAWSGEMGPSQIESMSSQHQMSAKEYMKECKHALTTCNGKPGMSYSVENNSFTWKKLIDEDSGMKVIMGAVKLEPANFTQKIQEVVDVALRRNMTLTEQVETMEKQVASSSSCNHNLIQQLEDLILVKNNIESELYAKFIDVLNAKKKRISELEERLSVQPQALGSKPTAAVGAVRKGREKKTRKVVEKVDDAYNMETDSDEEREMIKQSKDRSKRKIVERVGKRGSGVVGDIPSTSKLSPPPSITVVELSNGNVTEDVVENKKSIVKEENISIPLHTPEKSKTLPSTQKDLLNFFYGDDDSPQLVTS